MLRKASYLRSAISTLPVIVAGALLVANTAAQAFPVELSFSGTVTASPFLPPGVNVGNTITFDVFADNGGTSLISQTWTASQITSATIQAGTYSAATSGPQGFVNGSFSTNPSGSYGRSVLIANQLGADTNGNFIFFIFYERY
jgi:hypothetical protein